MIFEPPRHGKSEFVSKYFPAWFLGRFPNERVLFSSYESTFAMSWGRKVRDILLEYGPSVFDVAINPNNSSAGSWGFLKYEGGMQTAGVGAGLTGKGAHLLLIDDPIKGAEQSHSVTIRNKHWDWYRSEAYTRLAPGGRIILTLTRWHEDDLAGRILKDSQATGEQWEILRLPAIAEDDGDMLGRQPGEPLWPERFPLDRLLEIKATLGSYWWSALYQQRPAPSEGNIFKKAWFKYYRPAELGNKKFDEVVQSWDMAFKGGSSSAYVCGQVWGKIGADRYLLHNLREKLDFPGSVRAVRQVSEMYPQATRKYIEDAANGPAIIALLKSEIPGIIPVSPSKYGSKEARAHSISGIVESGNVYIPEPNSVTWSVDDFIEECITFPNSAYMDQVDTFSQALLMLMQKNNIILAPGSNTQSSKWR